MKWEIEIGKVIFFLYQLFTMRNKYFNAFRRITC